jgi:hypothetical protein
MHLLYLLLYPLCYTSAIQIYFTPLEKTTPMLYSGWPLPLEADSGLKPPSA